MSGYLLNQWSLSEYDGVLRVVSTDAPAWFESSDSSESSLTTLRAGDGALSQIGRVGNLGKGQRVYAVRFVGPTAYVVTFKQVDPLYTVDLTDPAQPRVLGELEIPGYSAYLHPIGDDLLLGIGQEVDDAGPTRRHAALALRRLRPPAPDAARSRDARPGLVRGGVRPPRVPLLADHRARRRPVRPAGGRLPRQPGARDRARRPNHAPAGKGVSPAIRRSLVVGDSVFTVSDAGVTSSVSARSRPGLGGVPCAVACAHARADPGPLGHPIEG